MDIKQRISQMTLEEKAGLCSGLTFWHTKAVERLDIPSIMMCDGPHGLRKERPQPDDYDMYNTEPATCFPTASLTACSWDPALARKMGEAIGTEAETHEVAIVLGPGANIKRSPLCGRNFEYLSEDPHLSSKMAAGIIDGIQSQDVGTSLKHFVANNQEHRRLVVDAQIPERPLREIYLASFEEAVKEAKPDTMMCAYNGVNGELCSQNKRLLTDILRDEWGYEGFVMSDWSAVDNRVQGLIAGLDLEMPTSHEINDAKIVKAVQDGTLDEAVLDRTVERLLKFILAAKARQREGVTYDVNEHHRLAADVARESMVLLRNEGNVLPLKKQGRYAVIGAMANQPRFQGSGSSRINPTKVSSIFDGIAAVCGEKPAFAQGYDMDAKEGDKPDEALLAQAVEAAKDKDAVIIVAGLPNSYESEGFDRSHMRIPAAQIRLIEEVARANTQVIVVLCNGAPVEMPWIDSTQAILESYLGGQAGGIAAAELLFGDANPCGKLAESFPKKLEDNPTYLNFPGEGNVAAYTEGLFVGYRYYDKKAMEPLFPFGFGLSYTKFEYSDLQVDAKEISEDDTLSVSVLVKNTGAVAGKEIVQLYVRDEQASVIRPEKELKAFAKVSLAPEEEKRVTMTLTRRAFAYYAPSKQDWVVESGAFALLVGASSRDIRLQETVTVQARAHRPEPVSPHTTLGELKEHPIGGKYYDTFAKAFGLWDGTSNEVLEMMHGFPIIKAPIMGPASMTEDDVTSIIKEINEAI